MFRAVEVMPVPERSRQMVASGRGACGALIADYLIFGTDHADPPFAETAHLSPRDLAGHL